MAETKRIYLDHNATTPVHPSVLEAMMPYFTEKFGNPSSIYQYGQEARREVEDAREKVAGLIGAGPDEIFFTGGGTESDNLAIKGTAYEKSAKNEKARHIITSAIEHHAVLNTCKYLEKKGFSVTYLPVDKYGLVDPEEARKAIRPGETILISVMHANNETGTIEPVAEIGAIARENGAYFHTDAVQSVGKIPVKVKELNADFLSLSAHKLYGPKGVGALYIRKGVRIEPLLHGGPHEKNRRAGTENVPGIAGLGRAAELAKDTMAKESVRLAALRDRLYAGISGKIKDVYINGHTVKRLSNTLNLSFKYIEGESIILNLDMLGMAVSSGSACTSGSLDPSHVLKAMGVDAALSQGSIRFSLGKDNTEEDIDRVAGALPEIVAKLRAMSPLYKK
jgi:cysteine desulfurase